MFVKQKDPPSPMTFNLKKHFCGCQYKQATYAWFIIALPPL